MYIQQGADEGKLTQHSPYCEGTEEHMVPGGDHQSGTECSERGKYWSHPEADRGGRSMSNDGAKDSGNYTIWSGIMSDSGTSVNVKT